MAPPSATDLSGSQAQAFQVMPEMSPEAFDALKTDIAERGMQIPIVVDECGNILDGRYRDRAWRELKKNSAPPTRLIAGLSDSEKRA